MCISITLGAYAKNASMHSRLAHMAVDFVGGILKVMHEKRPAIISDSRSASVYIAHKIYSLYTNKHIYTVRWATLWGSFCRYIFHFSVNIRRYIFRLCCVRTPFSFA